MPPERCLRSAWSFMPTEDFRSLHPEKVGGGHKEGNNRRLRGWVNMRYDIFLVWGRESPDSYVINRLLLTPPGRKNFFPWCFPEILNGKKSSKRTIIAWCVFEGNTITASPCAKVGCRRGLYARMPAGCLSQKVPVQKVGNVIEETANEKMRFWSIGKASSRMPNLCQCE